MKKLLLSIMGLLLYGYLVSQVTFSPEIVLSTGHVSNNYTHIVDLDQDGDSDFIASILGNRVEWIENIGNGEYALPDTVAMCQGNVQCAVSGDINEDGSIDIITVYHHKVVWFANDGTQNFSSEYVIKSGVLGPQWVECADYNNDGHLDVVASFYYADRIIWFENDGTGTFTEHLITSSADGVARTFSIDLENDGDIDVLSASWYDGKIALYKNDGYGNFSYKIITTSASGADAVYAADLDGDNDKDILSASFYDNKVAWHKNLGNGNSWNQQPISNSVVNASVVLADDFDNDGDNDLIYSGYYDKPYCQYNQGGGVFGQAVILSDTIECLKDIRTFDIDNDGDRDLITTSFTQGNISLFLNEYLNLGDTIQICQGDSILLGNVWYANNGISFDTLINVSGGDSIVITHIEVIDSPVAFSISGQSNVSVSQQEVYSVPLDSNVTYYWNVVDATITNQISNFECEVQFDLSGTSYVKVYSENNNGCVGDTIQFEVFVDPLVIDHYELKNPIRLFPNPNNGNFRIESKHAQILNVEFLNAQGKVLYTRNGCQNFYEIITGNYANGIYYVKCTTEKGTSCQKVILQ